MVSYVKPLKNEPWDEYQLAFLAHGGNYRFTNFMSKYGLKCKEVYKKYRHKGASYYMKKLRAKVDNVEFQVKPPRKEFA